MAHIRVLDALELGHPLLGGVEPAALMAVSKQESTRSWWDGVVVGGRETHLQGEASAPRREAVPRGREAPGRQHVFSESQLTTIYKRGEGRGVSVCGVEGKRKKDHEKRDGWWERWWKERKEPETFLLLGSDATMPPRQPRRGGENYVNTERRELTAPHYPRPLGPLIGWVVRASLGAAAGAHRGAASGAYLRSERRGSDVRPRCSVAGGPGQITGPPGVLDLWTPA